MSNILKAFNILIKNYKFEWKNQSQYSNRIQFMGEKLEFFIKDLFCNSFNINNQEDKIKRYKEIFSYLGNKNNPPDIILKNSDAIEIKKIEGLNNNLALNSSHPKDYLYNDDMNLTIGCKNCEDSLWIKKEIIYIIGSYINNKLRGVWMVYGRLYAADRFTYLKIKKSIQNNIQLLDLDLCKTNELAKIKKVDPLNITDLRVRGMWNIKHPSKVFDYLKLDIGKEFFANLLVPYDKFNMMPEDDIENLKNYTSLKSIKDPNNPIKDLKINVIHFHE